MLARSPDQSEGSDDVPDDSSFNPDALYRDFITNLAHDDGGFGDDDDDEEEEYVPKLTGRKPNSRYRVPLPTRRSTLPLE